MQLILAILAEAGISTDDVRIKESFGKNIGKGYQQDEAELDLQQFCELFQGDHRNFLHRTLSNQSAIPNFKGFCKDVEKYYHNTKDILDGEVDGNGNAKHYAISICTVDGQKYHIGDQDISFPLQSVCKAINYPIALHERGETKVHKHVGREPSGRGYNGLVLNQENLPHNPMINAGAIMVCSLIQPKEGIDQRLKHIKSIWSRLVGDTPIKFNKAIYEDESVERNMALSYYMKEKKAFPKGTDVVKTMEFYNKCCALEVNAEQLAMAAATLANGGCCPPTGDTVFSPSNVRDCLSLMLSCGMYDYSGEFAFLVGLPAKSGVSGAMMVVVPGLMGISIYSPPLDDMGNPVRGVEFCKEMVKEYSLHKFDHVTSPANNKKDPRKRKVVN